MKKTYKSEFMPYWLVQWYCSLTVLAWVLNYFFGTNFSSKDNFDLLGIANRSRWNRSDLLSLHQIALFLERSYLNVTIYTGMSASDTNISLTWSREEKTQILKKYIHEDFHHNIEDWRWQFEDWGSVDMIDDLLDNRIKKSTIWREYKTSANHIQQAIKENQWPWVLFVLWCNRWILHEWHTHKKDWEWHIVACSWITDENMCIIHEPNYPRPNPHYIKVSQVIDSMSDLWWIEMIKIVDNYLHV